MAGCTNCRSKSGCNDRKGSMFDAVYGVLERAYPTRCWGQADPFAALDFGVADDEGEALADALADELRASTFYRPGGAEDMCSYVYILCVGREPCLVQLRDGDVPVPAEVRDEPVREVYLRVALSSLGRLAGVQQVAMELDWDEHGYELREIPRDGVYDAPLLRRFQKLVATLPDHDLVSVDFGEICAPVDGYDSGDYRSLYQADPVLANFLFFSPPPTMRSATYIPVA